MKIDLPDGLELMARDLSRFKTPSRRTQGWTEQKHEVRGEGDILDTIGTIMLWRYLRELNIPATYYLTGGEGDQADIMVKANNGELNINVKTSKYGAQHCNSRDVCATNHIGVKEVELNKTLPEIYVQVFVHLGAHSHVHICNYIFTDSNEFVGQKITTIPNSNSTRGFWIPNKDLTSIHCLQKEL